MNPIPFPSRGSIASGGLPNGASPPRRRSALASRQNGRFSRRPDTAKDTCEKRQETQIVQSWLTLDDFLPGFRPHVLRRAALSHVKVAKPAYPM